MKHNCLLLGKALGSRKDSVGHSMDSSKGNSGAIGDSSKGNSGASGDSSKRSSGAIGGRNRGSSGPNMDKIGHVVTDGNRLRATDGSDHGCVSLFLFG